MKRMIEDDRVLFTSTKNQPAGKILVKLRRDLSHPRWVCMLLEDYKQRVRLTK